MKIPVFRAKAFTLSELLVSLSVLGLISALTLPVVFNAVNVSRKKAVFKETLNALNNMAFDGAGHGDGNQNTLDYFEQKLNVVECSTTLGVVDVSTAEDNMGCLLHNGAMLFNVNAPNNSGETLWVDWNGNEGPNTAGDDRLGVIINWGSENMTDWAGTAMTTLAGVAALRPGELKVIISWSGDQEGLYDDIYGN